MLVEKHKQVKGKKPAITYSTTKAAWHTTKIEKIRKGIPTAPTALQVDLEAFCNDSCEFCAYRKDDGYNNSMLDLLQVKPGQKHGDYKPLGVPNLRSGLPARMAKDLPRMMHDAGIKAIEITGGGEPTLWKHFDEFIDNLIKYDIEIGLVTNGSALPEPRMKKIASYHNTLWVRFSMDSSNPNLHRLIHRTPSEDFERRLANVTRFAALKHEDLELGISFIVTPNNYTDVENSAKLYGSIPGISHIRFSFMYDKQGTAGLTESQIDILLSRLKNIRERYQTDSFAVYFEKDRISSYSAPNTDFEKCYMQEFVWAIGADANVYPCCIMKYHPDYAFGSLLTSTLHEMVNDMDTISKKNNLDVGKCFPCWLRARNKAMQYIIEEPRHANFV